ncbi:MAG: beta-lactamase family protein [Bryobacteraceae bacterium]|nr:beta-lactamase family protein [Bryobacteraceae bacterium]
MLPTGAGLKAGLPASPPAEARALLASAAKGFTAMAIMMLAEQGKLRYDDLVERHVTELAGATPGITIRHLLTHASGIPDVGDLGINRPKLRERGVVNALRTHHTRFARPGSRYGYSNTGYCFSQWLSKTHQERRRKSSKARSSACKIAEVSDLRLLYRYRSGVLVKALRRRSPQARQRIE